MHIARKLLIAAALLSWPWIARAPQAAVMPPASTPAGLGFQSAPGLLHLVGDHDQDRERDRDQNRHHRHRHHHHRHGHHRNQNNQGQNNQGQNNQEH